MSDDFVTRDYMPENSLGGGDTRDVVPDGGYHIRAADIRLPTKNAVGAFILDLEVIVGTKPAKGMLFGTTIPRGTSKGSVKKRGQYAVAFGLNTAQEVVDSERNGTELVTDWSEIVGRTAACLTKNVKEQEKDDESGEYVDTDREKTEIDFVYGVHQIWHIDDPLVKRKGIPLDRSQVNITRDDAFGGSSPKSGPEVAKSDF